MTTPIENYRKLQGQATTQFLSHRQSTGPKSKLLALIGTVAIVATTALCFFLAIVFPPYVAILAALVLGRLVVVPSVKAIAQHHFETASLARVSETYRSLQQPLL